MKSRMNYGKMLIVGVCCLSLVFLCGCSSNNTEAKKEAPFQVGFCSLYVNDSAVSEFADEMKKLMPELSIGGNAPLFTSIIAGAVENDIESGIVSDPMMGMGGMMKLTAFVAAGELDVVICDMENAARNARGDMFLPLNDVFSDDELMALADKTLSFDLLETDGYETKATGEKTPVCGIDITGNAKMESIFGSREIGVFIISNTNNLELAKAVMQLLI